MTRPQCARERVPQTNKRRTEKELQQRRNQREQLHKRDADGFLAVPAGERAIFFVPLIKQSPQLPLPNLKEFFLVIHIFRGYNP